MSTHKSDLPLIPRILCRPSLATREEITEMQAEFQCYTQRTQARAGQLIIGRYSVLPYYAELEADLLSLGASLLNTHYQHRFIADLANWTDLLGPEITPPAISDFSLLSEAGKYVVKGETNSRKNNWLTSMYADGRASAIGIRAKLQQDGLICDQTIYARPYVPLRRLRSEPGIGGQPVTEEYRFFCCDGEILCGAYYWSQYVDDLPVVPISDESTYEFVRSVLDIVGDIARGIVIDVGIKEDGWPMVVELNDLQMSGLSCVDPKELYRNLRRVLEAKNR